MSVNWTVQADAAAALRAAGIESDLTDAQLHKKALSAVQEIASRGLGPETGIVRRHDGGLRYIFLNPPAATITSVTENGIILTEDTDYRIGAGGAYIERLLTGYPGYFGRWIDVEYDGAVGDERYDRVVTDLVRLALEYSGLDSRRDGDYAEESKGARGGGAQHNYQLERESLISELIPAGVGFA